MNQYSIQSISDVCVDDYHEGQGDTTNWYKYDNIIMAKSPLEAVKSFVEYMFDISFNSEDFMLDSEKNNVIHTGFSVKIDEDGHELKPSDEDIELWKEGRKTLYTNNLTIHVKELVPADLSMFFKQ
jgi:hypothetical protein